MRKISTAAIMSLSLVLCPSSLVAEEEKPLPTPPILDAYRVGTGDILRVVVWKKDDLSGEHLVRPDGIITLPLVGDIIAGGNTTDAIALQIERKVKYYIEQPFISVFVLQANSNMIYVLGEVAKPGAYHLPGRMTVLQALALAGGYTQFADRDDMALIRMEGDKLLRYPLRFSSLVKEPEKGKIIFLNRGDTLIVP